MQDKGEDTSGEEMISLNYLKALGSEYDKWKKKMKKEFGDKFIIVDNNKYVAVETILKILNKNL